jgi:glutathione peroxidase
MTLYDHTIKAMDGNMVSMRTFKGKVLLIVNTAPKCGFAPQYEQLESLYASYGDKGLEILDFPSNQFMNQAPGTDEEIKAFCTLNYGTTFQTFSKIDVNGKDAIPLYRDLRKAQPKDYSGEKRTLLSRLAFSDRIRWNFTKFLVDREGNVVNRFAPSYSPEKIRPYIEALL